MNPNQDFPEEHRAIKRSLWQRWSAWNRSFLVISILLHLLLFGGATMVVAQVVQNRKEKMKFTAPPPSANASVEHKVKPSKKTAAAAPAISKRITSSAVNATIALPSMDLNSTGPDVMASVMSGMGASGLGSGAGGGAAGMASMPLAGLTAFGFKGGMAGGLKGQIYDLKQSPDHQPTEMMSGTNSSMGSELYAPGGGYTVWTVNQLKFFSEFFTSGWDEKKLERFYRAKESVTAFQIMVPGMPSTMGPKSFGVEKEIPYARHWMVHYKGKVTAPRDGTFRFVGKADDMIAVRFDNQNVFVHTLQNMDKQTMASFTPPLTQKKRGYRSCLR